MKIAKIVNKEISLIKSQKIALLLVVLYPLLVIGLLGYSFTGNSFSNVNINVGITEGMDKSNSTYLLNGLENNSYVKITKFTNVDTLKNALRDKKINAGLSIAKEGNASAKAIIYYDNSNLYSYKFFNDIIKYQLGKVATDYAKTQLKDIWTGFGSFGKDLSDQAGKVDSLNQKLDSAEKNLNDLDSKTSQINITELNQMISRQETSVNSMKQKIPGYRKDISDSRAALNNASNDLNSAGPALAATKSQLTLISQQMQNDIDALDNTISLLVSIQGGMANPAQMQPAINTLTSVRNDLVTWRSQINSAIVQLDTASTRISSVQMQISLMQIKLNQMDADLNEIDAALSSSQTDIATMKANIQSLNETLIEINTISSESRASKEETTAELRNFKEDISDFSTKMSDINSINSGTFAEPLIIFEEGVFTADSFGILVSNAISLVLILTCVLLTAIVYILEKNENILLRNEMTPTSKSVLLSGKMIGQLVIALIEAAVIFAIAMMKIQVGSLTLGFGLATKAHFYEVLFAVIAISVTFIAIGMFIASFSKNQSTAILMSLLAIIPMIFISGIVLPLEFMHPSVKTISTLMPLTAANNMMIKVLVRELPMKSCASELAILLSITTICIMAAASRRNLTKD